MIVDTNVNGNDGNDGNDGLADAIPSLRSAQTTEISLTTLAQPMLNEMKTKPTRLSG